MTEQIQISMKIMPGVLKTAWYEKRGIAPGDDISLDIPEGTQTGALCSLLELPSQTIVSFIRDGRRIEPGEQLFNSDELTCVISLHGG